MALRHASPLLPSHCTLLSPSASLRFSQSCLVRYSFHLQSRYRNFGSEGSLRGSSNGSFRGEIRSGLGFGLRGDLRCRARRRDEDTQEFDDYIDPAKTEPIEAIDPDEEEMSKFDRVVREADRVRKSQEEEYKRTKPIFMRAIGLGDQVDNDQDEIPDSDDTFDLVNEAVASKKMSIKTTKPKAKTTVAPIQEVEEELDPTDDAVPLLDEDDEEEEDEGFIDFKDGTFGGLAFDDDVDGEDDNDVVTEPTYRMTLGELLDEARVTPISIEGDLDVEITGIQHDSRHVIPGDLFVCVKGLKSDGHEFANQAIEKGAIAIISSSEVPPTEGLVAAVIVEDTKVLLSALAGNQSTSAVWLYEHTICHHF